MQNDSFLIKECPCCGAQVNHVTNWTYSGLGDSVFNYTAKFMECVACRGVFIGNISDVVLEKFYNGECSYFESAHFSVESAENREKYAFYREFLVENALCDVSVADIGCGRGGFLRCLSDNAWAAPCYGIDVDVRSLALADGGAGKGANIRFENGGCLNVPLPDQSVALITYFHVLEHIRDLSKVFSEAARVTKSGGSILIDVPDAERYGAMPVGSAFWFSIREHVNHFSVQSLALALERAGFSIVKISRPVLRTPEFSYPSLVVLAQKGAARCGIDDAPSGGIAEFCRHSLQRLVEQARDVKRRSGGGKVTFWGCSAELFSLLPVLGFENIALCDASPSKQTAFYHGIPVQEPNAVPKEGLLVVAPYLHGSAIERAARASGWSQDAIYLLS
ncbi:MAG: class I SAM-dependent methyltransferase [Methanobacterium sp.]|nr:class I SAM-dependent methyltransferase [Methanobacterium sp.]